jgi:PAS domain S-box-containing protein
MRTLAKSSEPDLPSTGVESFDPKALEILEATPHEIVIWDTCGKVIYANKRALDFHGFSLDNIQTGDIRAQLYHPDDLPIVAKAIKKAVAQGEPLEVRARLLRHDGRYLWFLIRSNPVRDESGRVVRWCGTLIDVDEEMQVEDRLRLTIDTTPAMVHTALPDGGVDYFNQRWREYLGVPPEEILGWKWTSLVHPDDVTAFVGKWRKSLQTGAPFEAESRVRRADGTYRWLLHRKVPLRNEQGQIVKWHGSSVDIDELKRSEFYLGEGQRLSHVGSWTFNSSGFDHWSSELFRMHGLDPNAKAPSLEEYLALVHPEDREFVMKTVQKMFAEGCGFDFTKRIVRPDGEIRRVRCVGVPATHGGRFQTFIGTGMDVTEQEELTQDLRRREALLAEAQKLGHTGSCGWNVVTGEQTWSEENYRILGYDPSVKPTLELIRDRVHPDDLQVWGEAMARALEGKQVDIEHRLLMPDGSVKHLHVVAYGVQRDGKLVEIVGMATDITERKRSEEAIRRSEAFLAHAQKLSHTGSFSSNITTGERFWSEETYRIFEFEPSSKVTLEMALSRVHPKDIPSVKEAIAAVKRREGMDLEYRLMMPDGRIKYLHIVGTTQRNDTGNVELVGAVMDVTERKLTEFELQRNKAQLTNAQTLSRTGSVGMDVSTGRIFWSEEAARINGYPPGTEPTPELILARVHPDDLSLMKGVLEQAAQGEQDFDFEHRLVMPDGAIKYIKTLCQCVRDETGNEEILGAITDITEHKLSEQAIRRSEAYLAEAQRLSKTGSFAWSPTADNTYWSEECYRVLGFEPQGATPPRFEAIMERIHPDDQVRSKELVEKSVREKVDIEVDYRIIHPDKRVRDIHCVGKVVLDRSGELLEIVGTVIDITERKRAEESIRRSEAFLAEGQRLSHTGSWLWNAANDDVTWSQECLRIVGLDPENTKASSEAFWERVHPEDRPGFQAASAAAIRDKKDFEYDFRIVTTDWVIRHLHSVIHAVLNESGELVELVGTTMDVTERKRAEERAQSQQEAIRLALSALVEELDVDRFLVEVITGLTKQFHAAHAELWLLDESTGTNSLYMAFRQGKVIRSENEPKGGLQSGMPHTRLSSGKGRNPKIFEIPADAALIPPTHGEFLKRQGVKTLMIVPLVLGEQKLGYFELHFKETTQFTPDDLDLAQALVHHATLALQLSRLAHRTEQMAVTEERNRLARDIHDTLAQALAGIVLHTEALKVSLPEANPRIEKSLLQIQKLARSGLDEARRSVQALRPKELHGSTLSQALELAANRFAEDAKLLCEFKQMGKPLAVSPEVQNELYRIAQEAVTNIGKHARAKCAWVTLEFKAHRIILTVRDNGVGFSTKSSRKRKSGYGLTTMRERSQRIGGRLEIKRPSTGGTIIRVTVPSAEKANPR